MKYILLIVTLMLSCIQHDYKLKKNFREHSVGNKSVIKKASKEYLEELRLPYCFKVETLPTSNYYQTNLDTFLIHHNLKRDNVLNINKKFHKNTVDFISDKQSNFMHYLYHGNAYAIKKLTINSEITAILYGYIYDSEMIQPRIEIQTFDKKQNNIDNLIIASTFSSECSGYRDFCVNNDKIITINNYYYCNDINTEYKNIYKFKINDKGRFIYAE